MYHVKSEADMNIALVLSGGIGTRTGYSVPKQYITINDKPIIVYALENLQSSGLFDEIYVICSDDWRAFVTAYAGQYGINAFQSTITAGKSRCETVKAGIDFLAEHHKQENDIICIVESVRPVVPHKVLQESIKALKNHDCVTGVIPVHDSLFSIDPHTRMINGRTDTSQLYTGVTPISARLKDMIQAVRCTDEQGELIPLTTAMMRLNKKIGGIEGSAKSIKITTSDDFSIVSALLRDS